VSAPSPTIVTSKVIAASAGTGKTYRLAMRYIALLAQGERPESLLATTFTRKAAGEMLDRVLKFLAQATRDPKRLAELQQHAHPSLTREQCGTLLQNLVACFGRVRIQTLDALLQRVASSAALSIGISPSWTILDDAQQEELTLSTLEEMVARKNSGDAVLLQHLMYLSGSAPSASVHEPLLKLIKDVTSAYHHAQERPEPWYLLQPTTARLTDEQLADLARQLATRVELVPRTKAGKPNVKFAEGVQKLATLITDRDWLGLCESTLLLKLQQPDPCYYNAAIPSALIDLLHPLADHLRAHLRQQLTDRNIHGYAIISMYETLALQERQAACTFTFSDIPHLLRSAPYAGGLDHTFFSLDATIRHILLDEFQDTSLEQFNLIRVLLDECAQSDDGRTVFFVGDSKQSLYGWRGGAPELLDSIGSADLYPGMARENLSTNYRSGRNILNFVNTAFADLSSNPALLEKSPAAAAAWAPRFTPHTPSPTAPEGSVIIRLTGRAAEGDTDADTLAATTAERIAELHKSFPHASIAVLVRNKSRFPRMRYELSRRGIDASQEGVARLIDSPTVATVLSLLQLIAHPSDTAARYHVATSPLGKILQFTDHTRDGAAMTLARRARRTIRRRGLPRVLSKLARLLAPHTDARGMQRLARLTELATTDPTPLDLDRFVHIARNHTLHDVSDVRVRLMTVHNAKGLEFDIVILPDVHRPWNLGQASVLTARPNPLDPLNLITLRPPAPLRKIDAELQSLHQSNLDRVISEELSVLYVALTRAIHHLEIILPGKDRPKKPSISVPCSGAGLLYGPFDLADQVYFPDPDSTDGSSPDPGTPDAVVLANPIYAQGTVSIPAATIAPPVAPRTVSLALSATDPARSGARRRVSPSGLEGSALVNLSDLIAPPSDTLEAATSSALLKGLAIHALFEQVEWIESSDALTDDHLSQTLTALDVPRDLIPSFLAEFRQLLKAPSIRTLLSRPSARAMVRREWAFLAPATLADGSDVLLDGRFDRVHIDLDPSGRPIGAQIIDFKTDTPSPKGSGAAEGVHGERVKHYTPQLHAYAAALATLLALPPSAISATLLFTATASVIPIPPPPTR
jgi:ATP-dependent helicase/nuclease subunit A